MKQKGFAPIIILVLVVLAVIGYFGYKNWVKLKTIATPTPSPAEASTQDGTVNWKTYTNTKYGFSIKYPSGWNIQTIISSSDGSGFSNVTGTDSNIEISNTSGMVVPSVQIDVINQSLEKQVASYKNTLENSPAGRYSNVNQYSGSFMGADATIFEAIQTLSPNYTVNIKDYNFKSPNNYVMSVIRTGNNTDQTELDQILSTFKFTN